MFLEADFQLHSENLQYLILHYSPYRKKKKRRDFSG